MRNEKLAFFLVFGNVWSLKRIAIFQIRMGFMNIRTILLFVVGFGMLVHAEEDSKKGVQECSGVPELLLVYKNAQKDGDVSSMMWALREDKKKPQGQRELPELVNLCDINVFGSDTLFCQKNKKISRINMPQLSGMPVSGSPADVILNKKGLGALVTKNKDIEAILQKEYGKPGFDLKLRGGEVDAAEFFKEYLKQKKYTIKRTEIPAAQLMATQDQLVTDKVNSMWWALEVGECSGSYEAIVAPIFVSKDNYVLDGHHRWAAVVANAFGRININSVNMQVFQVDEGIDRLVDLANEFARDFGISAKAG